MRVRLVKRYTFRYLTSGRDLLRLKVRTKAQHGGVIFADPSFDATGPAPPAGSSTRGRRSADLRSGAWRGRETSPQPVDLATTGVEQEELRKLSPMAVRVYAPCQSAFSVSVCGR